MWTEEQKISRILREIKEHENFLKSAALKYYEHLGFKSEDFDPLYKKFQRMTTKEKINHMRYCDTKIDYDKKIWSEQQVKDLVIYLFCSGCVGYEYVKEFENEQFKGVVMDQKNTDKKIEHLSEDEFLGIDKYTYHILKYIFSACNSYEIECIHNRLLSKQCKIDDIIMEEFPSRERHNINLEDQKMLDGYRLKSILNHNATKAHRIQPSGSTRFTNCLLRW